MKKETEFKEELKEVDSEEVALDSWWLVIFLIFAFMGFNNPPQKLGRKELLHQINDSDLSNSEKKRINEILLN